MGVKEVYIKQWP